MHNHSLDLFLKSKYAALRKHKAIFFMALLAMMIFSVYLILAAIEVGVAPTSGNTDAFTNFTFSINHTEGGGAPNITVVSIMLPNATGLNVTYNQVNSSGVAIATRTGIAIFSNNGTNSPLQYNWTTDGNLPLIDNVNNTAVPNRTFSISLNSSVAGDVILRINLTYSNGSMSTTTKTITFNDNVAPKATDILPAGSNFTSDTTPTIYINITDTGSDVNTSLIVMELGHDQGGVFSGFFNVSETLTDVYLGGNRNGYQVKYTWGTNGLNEPALSGGENISVRVTARDNSSNANAMTPVLYNITIDTAAPNITITSPAADTNLTGAADNITAQVADQWVNSVNVSDVFAAIKNSSGYYDFDNAALNRTGDYQNWTRLDQSGSTAFFNATLNSSNFSDGTYTLYVNASDLAGNMRESSTRKITIDNTAPSSFNLVQPANNTNATGRTPTLKWEPTTETNFLNYTIQVDDNSDFSSINETRSTTLATDNSTTLLTLAADGKFYWRVTAWDAAGNSRSSTSTKFEYITDNTAPTITVDTPSGNVNLTGAADNITVTVNENVSAVYGALRNGTGATINYYDLNGTRATGDFTTWSPFNHSRSGVWYNRNLNSNNFSDGSYILYINATDLANNNATDSTIVITIDNTAPSAFNLVLPANSTVTTNRTPTLRWESSNELNFLNYTMQIDDNADFSSITNTSGTYANITNKTGVSGTILGADTAYYWRVVAFDAAGNSRTASSFTYTTDNTALQIAITAPLNNTNQTAADVNITVNVTDANINVSDVFAALKNATAGYYKLDGTRLVSGTDGYTNWTNLKRSGSTTYYNSTLNADNFADGSYLLYVNASDNASNVANNKSINITIDNNAPTYANLLPGDGNLTNDATPTVYINLTDTTTKIINDSIEVQWKRITWTNISTVVTKQNIANGIQISFTLGSQPDGAVIYIYVDAFDSVGNAMTRANWSFTVDVTAPTIIIEAPATNQTNQTASNVNISVQVTDTNRNNSDVWAALKNVTGYYRLNGNRAQTGDYQNWTNLKRLGSTNSFNATLNADAFADGEYRLYINTTDLGASTTENKSFILHVDNSGPTITLSTPNNNSNTTATQVGFVWTATDQISTNMTCNLTIDSSFNKSVVAVNATAVANQTVTGILNGTHTWGITCIDEVGNTNSSDTRTFYSEAAAFAVTLNAPANYYNSSSAVTVRANWTVSNPTYSSVGCNVSLDSTEINNTAQIVVTNGTNSNWYNFSNLSQGLHEWNVSCRDALYTVNSSTRYFTVDTNAPAVQILDANNTNTTSTTPTVTFNATDALSANFTCDLYLTGSSTSKGTNSSVLNYTAVENNATINMSNTAEGSYTYYINCTDYASNTGQSKKMNITIDTTAPVVSIESPLNNTNQTTYELVNVTANVSEAYLQINTIYGALKSGSTYYDLAGTAATGDYTTWTNLKRSGSTTFFNSTLNASNFSDGTYKIYANASDPAGNIGTAKVMSIVIDKTAPKIENITINNASVGQTVTVSVNVSDATSGVSGPTAAFGNCTFYFNSTFMASVLYDSAKGGCVKSFTIPGTFTAGNYTLGINVTDYANNNGTNTSYKVQVLSDTQAPTISITLPANFTNQSSTSLNVSWTVTDNLDTAMDCNITIGNTNTTTITTNGTLNSTLITVSAGDRQPVNVTCWDDALNTNRSPTYLFTIDTTAPAADYGGAAPSDASNRSINSIFVNVSYNETNYGSIIFYLYNSDGTLNSVNSYTSSTNFSNFTSLAAGTYSFSATVNDSANNKAALSNRTVTLDTTAPVVEYAAATPSGATNRSINSIYVNVTFNETNYNAIIFYLYNSDGTLNSAVNHTNKTNNANNKNFTGLSDGTYSFSATVNDSSNNPTALSNRTVTLDTTAPTVALNINNNTNQSSTTFIANWTATDARDTVLVCDLWLNSARNTTSVVSVDNGTNKNWYNVTGLAEGNYVWYANCTDEAGNTGVAANRSFTVDSSVPAVTINQPEANDYNRSSLLINVTAVDTYTNVTNTTLQFRFVNVSGIGNTTAWDNFTLTTTISATVTYDVTTLIDGKYTIQVRANDTLNQQNSTTNVSITIDNTAPGLTSWNYSSISKNLTLVFNETVDPTTIDLSKISLNYSAGQGSSILSDLTTSGPIVTTSSNSSSLSTTINISLSGADYGVVDQKASTNMTLTIQANAIKDRAGSNVVANYKTVTNWGYHNITKPNYGSNLGPGWADFVLLFAALEGTASLGSNYNITNVLASIRSNYQIVYAYNSSSASWLSYVPGAASGNNFLNFTLDTSGRAYELYMTNADRIEII